MNYEANSKSPYKQRKSKITENDRGEYEMREQNKPNKTRKISSKYLGVVLDDNANMRKSSSQSSRDDSIRIEQNPNINSTSRTTSLNSVVIQEQYCCISKMSFRERMLVAAIGVFAIIVIVLIIVISVLASRDNNSYTAVNAFRKTFSIKN